MSYLTVLKKSLKTLDRFTDRSLIDSLHKIDTLTLGTAREELKLRLALAHKETLDSRDVIILQECPRFEGGWGSRYINDFREPIERSFGEWHPQREIRDYLVRCIWMLEVLPNLGYTLNHVSGYMRKTYENQYITIYMKEADRLSLSYNVNNHERLVDFNHKNDLKNAVIEFESEHMTLESLLQMPLELREELIRRV